MRLTTEQVGQYKNLYEKRFGKSISDEEALSQGLALIQLVCAGKDATKEDFNGSKQSPETNQ